MGEVRAVGHRSAAHRSTSGPTGCRSPARSRGGHINYRLTRRRKSSFRTRRRGRRACDATTSHRHLRCRWDRVAEVVDLPYCARVYLFTGWFVYLLALNVSSTENVPLPTLLSGTVRPREGRCRRVRGVVTLLEDAHHGSRGRVYSGSRPRRLAEESKCPCSEGMRIRRWSRGERRGRLCHLGRPTNRVRRKPVP